MGGGNESSPAERRSPRPSRNAGELPAVIEVIIDHSDHLKSDYLKSDSTGNRVT